MPKFCTNCGKPLREFDAVCPHCGRLITDAATTAPPAPEPPAPRPPEGPLPPEGPVPPETPPVPAPRRQGPPRTIGELRAYAAEHNWPLADMRFYLGEDHRGPRAFGIYESGGEYIVYKNKTDGSRAIRYQGPDEAYAVNELFQKMRSEVANQKAAQAARYSPTPPRKPRRGLPTWAWALIILAAVLAFRAVRGGHRPDRGYYHYDNDYYYYQNNDWYLYDTYYNSWYEVEPPAVFADDYDDYYAGYGYSSVYGVDDFYDSGYYEAEEDSGSWLDSDDDDDWWDSGSDWDSGFTDWDSDW